MTIGSTFPPLRLAERYCENQVILCTQGAEALATLTQLKQDQVPVILLIVDQHLSDRTGVSFLDQAKQLVPTAKCLLVNQEGEHTLGVQPFKIDAIVGTCVPPEEFLFPVIDALLEQVEYESRAMAVSPLFTGIRVIGHRWSAESHRVKDFLARHAIPFQWVDLETHPEALPAFVHDPQSLQFPLLQFPDGSWITQPTPAQLAEKIGLVTQSETPFYDLIIIGAGSCGPRCCRLRCIGGTTNGSH